MRIYVCIYVRAKIKKVSTPVLEKACKYTYAGTL